MLPALLNFMPGFLTSVLVFVAKNVAMWRCKLGKSRVEEQLVVCLQLSLSAFLYVLYSFKMSQGFKPSPQMTNCKSQGPDISSLGVTDTPRQHYHCVHQSVGTQL